MYFLCVCFKSVLGVCFRCAFCESVLGVHFRCQLFVCVIVCVSRSFGVCLDSVTSAERKSVKFTDEEISQ